MEITALAAILNVPVYVAIKKNSCEYYWAIYGANRAAGWKYPPNFPELSTQLNHLEICNENFHYDVVVISAGSLPSSLPPAAILTAAEDPDTVDLL